MDTRVEVFTAVPGDVRRIGNYGAASNEAPAMVPAEVAATLGPRFRVGEAAPTPPAHGLNGPMTAWHAKDGDVHHTEEECALGNNIEPRNRRKGMGRKPLCEECSKLRAASVAPKE